MPKSAQHSGDVVEFLQQCVGVDDAEEFEVARDHDEGLALGR